MDGKYNLLFPALGIIAALLWRLIYSVENRNSTIDSTNGSTHQPSSKADRSSYKICAKCGLDRIPYDRESCRQCGSKTFEFSPQNNTNGYCIHHRPPKNCNYCNDPLFSWGIAFYFDLAILANTCPTPMTHWEWLLFLFCRQGTTLGQGNDKLKISEREG